MSDTAMISLSTSPGEPWWAPVWARHRQHYEIATAHRLAGEGALRRELVFCVLGGHGVTFELALSASRVINALRPFDQAWTPKRLRQAISRELSKPQFEPRRHDGTLCRYRYPRRKAHLIAEAVAWVQATGSLRKGLAACRSEHDRRTWLCQCPGIGMKSASWLLRNCGWASNLAILDVHLVRALTEANVIESATLPRDYAEIEAAYLSWAAEIGACPAALDLFLWDVQRSC